MKTPRKSVQIDESQSLFEQTSQGSPQLIYAKGPRQIYKGPTDGVKWQLYCRKSTMTRKDKRGYPMR